MHVADSSGAVAICIHVLACLGIFIWLAVWAFSFLGWYLVATKYAHSRKSQLSYTILPAQDMPGVSIIRPLKGLEVNLYDNIQSCILQNYPRFEVILAVGDENDKALEIAQQIQHAHSAVPIHIIVGDLKVGINPKVNNLMRAHQSSQYDLLWVLDSNVFVSPDTLANSVDAFSLAPASQQVGLVHHVPMPYMIDQDYVGGRLEKVYLGAYHSRMYIAANWVNLTSCVNGKSNMYLKSDVDKLSGNLSLSEPAPARPGLHNFGKYLAEDNMIGIGIREELGKGHVLTSDIAWNTVGKMTLRAYVLRRIRWSRCPLSGLIGYKGWSHFVEAPPIAFGFAHVLLWLFMEWHISSVMSQNAPKEYPQQSVLRDFVSFAPFWILKEMLEPPTWLMSFAGNEVKWRNSIYRLDHSGHCELIRTE